MAISSRRTPSKAAVARLRYERLPQTFLLILPAALTVYLAFNGGGYFADGTAVATLALALALTLRVTLEARPLGRPTAPAVVAIACLTAFAVWILLSGLWSDSWSRALVEFDRALGYLLALVLYATLVRAPRNVASMLRWFALGAVGICAVALASRVLPELISSRPNVANSRLSYPTTYWNALGLLGVLGVLACLHLAASAREPRAIRVISAAAIPLLSVTVYFTFSRGAVLVGVLGLCAYAVLGRPRGLLGALISTAPVSAIAVAVAYGAELLASRDPTAPAASSQASRVAAMTAIAMVAAAVLRALLLRLDRRPAMPRLSARGRRAVAVLVAGLAGLALIGGGLALDAPAKLERQYDRFLEGTRVSAGDDARGRFTDPGNNGRVDYWNVSLDGWQGEPLRGVGAGGWEFLWARERPIQSNVINGHSLYLEVLAELGIVGGGLLGVALIALLAGIAVRMRGPERSLYAALFALSLTWALHAGIDWDWEMPVASLWMFALGGAALARGPGEGPAPLSPARLSRVVIALGCLVLAITPALLFLSQRQLNRSVDSLKGNDCGEALDAALASNSFLSVRPEPLEVLAYCDVRLGRPELAVQLMREAVERDPYNWRLHYGLALTRGAAGLDPRAQARRALRLNPRSSLTRDAIRRFDTSSPRTWRRRALSARLPLN
jgi:O-antigen ligase